MKIQNSKFVKSYTFDLPTNLNSPEFAFVGRSNVGKSSLINYLTNSKIAKTSSQPGRTRLINYFSINNEKCYFVDLPGYGFAESSKQEKDNWGKLIENYLINTKNLKMIFFLLDIRHTPSNEDYMMLNYMVFYNIPFTIIATKSDKLSKSMIFNYKQKLASSIKVGMDNVIVVSATKRVGAEEILQRLDQFIN